MVPHGSVTSIHSSYLEHTLASVFRPCLISSKAHSTSTSGVKRLWPVATFPFPYIKKSTHFKQEGVKVITGSLSTRQNTCTKTTDKRKKKGNMTSFFGTKIIFLEVIYHTMKQNNILFDKPMGAYRTNSPLSSKLHADTFFKLRVAS